MAKSIINTVTKRRNLKPRSWPYWETITKGRSVGFYRSETGGNWHARIRQPDSSYTASPIGGDISSDYAEMLDRAREWFDKAEGAEDVRYTVQKAVDDYVAHLRLHNGEDSAKGVQARPPVNLQTW